MNRSVTTRLAKILTSLRHPVCWKALSRGVAPVIEHLPLLRRLDVDGILDVGANRGQFSLACRIAMRGIPVLAFEPIPSEAGLYEEVHKGSGFSLQRYALGEVPETALLHISQSKDSSSLLPIGRRQVEAFPETAETGTMSVEVRTLDSFLPETAGRIRQLLKIDVQGFELNVLRGAREMLRSCRYVYAECSEVPLYDGQALRPEVAAFLKDAGFAEREVLNPSYIRGELIQADYLYERIKSP
jgi:FkbM family methyltransferase